MLLKAKSKKDLLVHLLVILAIGMVMIFLFFYVYLPITTNHGETIKVPDLKGKTLAEIEDILGDKNLRYQVNDSSYVAGAVPLSVISQNPVMGSEVKANRKIYVTITATSPPMVSMPELKEKSQKNAELVLKSHGLILDKVNSVPSPYASFVLRQYVNGKEIAKDTKIPKGTKVTLDVGNGTMTSEIELPLLVGLNIDDAKAELLERGLTVGMEKKEQVSGKEKGEVIRQKPEYRMGAKINTGESVDLYYAE
jgi:beta-lactam-binding protein with PASTA domain